MFLNSSKILFFTSMVISTLIAVSSNTWLGAWMGLEINLLSFIPLMGDNNNLMSSEASLKYFLVQALASSVLLFAALLSSLESSVLMGELPFMSSLIIVSSLVMSSGVAPFHLWFVLVMEGLSWFNVLILMTWQKLAPLAMISYLINGWMLSITALLCATVGSLGGLSQTSLRKLMAYSSINHLGWMIAAMSSSEVLWLTYFGLYGVLSAPIILIFLSKGLSHINQLSFSFSSNSLKFISFLCLMSLGGLPPFLGFFPKWIVIQQMVSMEKVFLVLILSSLSLVTLFFYLRLCYTSFTVSSPSTSWLIGQHLSSRLKFSFLPLAAISLMGLLAISLLILLT